MKPKLGRATLALALAYALVGWCAEGRAEPLITQGVGIASCGKLANDLKPSQGLNHPPNYLLFYWVQGYVSAANFLLLNENHNFIDMNEVTSEKILQAGVRLLQGQPSGQADQRDRQIHPRSKEGRRAREGRL